MKNYLTLSLVAMLLLFSYASQAVVSPIPNDQETIEKENAKEKAKEVKENWKKLSRKERRVKKRQLKKDLKAAIKANKKAGSDVDMTLLVVIAIFIPFLAMGLYEGGITERFWISLILSLLFLLPGIVYTLIIILNGK